MPPPHRPQKRALGHAANLVTSSGEKPVERGCEELWKRELLGLHKNEAGDPSHTAHVTAVTGNLVRWEVSLQHNFHGLPPPWLHINEFGRKPTS